MVSHMQFLVTINTNLHCLFPLPECYPRYARHKQEGLHLVLQEYMTYNNDYPSETKRFLRTGQLNSLIQLVIIVF